MFPAAIPKKTS